MSRVIKVLCQLPILLIVSACTRSNEPSIKAGVDACANCNMVIDNLNQAAGFFLDDEFFPFDSPVCMLNQIVENRRAGGISPNRISVVDNANGVWYNAADAGYLITDHQPTVMSSRTICFANLEVASANKKFPDEVVTNWRGFCKSMGIPDQHIAVRFEKETMIPDQINCQKGELIEFEFDHSRLVDTLRLSIQGYAEDGVILIIPGSGTTLFRVLADKPGAGFAISRNPDGKVYGMIKVFGAHTSEEEVM